MNVELTPQEKKVESELQKLQPAPVRATLIQRVHEQWNASGAAIEIGPLPDKKKTLQLSEWMPLFKVAAILVVLGAITVALLDHNEPEIVDIGNDSVLPHNQPIPPRGNLSPAGKATPVSVREIVRGGELFQQSRYELQNSTSRSGTKATKNERPDVIIVEMPLNTY